MAPSLCSHEVGKKYAFLKKALPACLWPPQHRSMADGKDWIWLAWKHLVGISIYIVITIMTLHVAAGHQSR